MKKYFTPLLTASSVAYLEALYEHTQYELHYLELCQAISSHRKNLFSSNMNFGALAAEIGRAFPTNFKGFRVLAALLHGWASSTLCGVEQRAPPMLGRASIALGMGPHFWLLN